MRVVEQIDAEKILVVVAPPGDRFEWELQLAFELDLALVVALADHVFVPVDVAVV